LKEHLKNILEFVLKITCDPFSIVLPILFFLVSLLFAPTLC